MVSVDVSKLACTKPFPFEPGVKVDGRSSAEEADAVIHASHCWQHASVPAGQRTCTLHLRDSSSDAAGNRNTGMHMSRCVVTKHLNCLDLHPVDYQI